MFEVSKLSCGLVFILSIVAVFCFIYFLCVLFCSPSWSGTQYIAQASLELMMVHLSAGIINPSHCTRADLSRQIQRQRGGGLKILPTETGVS